MTRLNSPIRGIVLIEGLLATALCCSAMSSLTRYAITTSHAKKKMATRLRCARERARAELALGRVFSRLLDTSSGRESAQTSPLVTNFEGTTLQAYYRPLFPSAWSLGARAKARLFVNEAHELYLQSVPVALAKERDPQLVAPCSMKLLSDVKALTFAFISASQKLVEEGEEMRGPSPNWLNEDGQLPAMVKVRVEFFCGDVWEFAHLIEERAFHFHC